MDIELEKRLSERLATLCDLNVSQQKHVHNNLLYGHIENVADCFSSLGLKEGIYLKALESIKEFCIIKYRHLDNIFDVGYIEYKVSKGIVVDSDYCLHGAERCTPGYKAFN